MQSSMIANQQVSGSFACLHVFAVPQSPCSSCSCVQMQLGQRGPKPDAPEFARARYLLANLGLSVSTSCAPWVSWHPAINRMKLHACTLLAHELLIHICSIWLLGIKVSVVDSRIFVLRQNASAPQASPASHQSDSQDAEGLSRVASI